MPTLTRVGLAGVLLLSLALAPPRGGAADPAVSGSTQAAAPASLTAPRTEPPPPIPIDQIAPRAAEVTQLIGTFAASPFPDHEVATIQERLPQVRAELGVLERRTAILLAEQPSLEMLQTQEQLWRQRRSELTTWLELLSARVTGFQDALNQLHALRETWTRTRESATAAEAPAQVVQQVDSTLAAIESARPMNRAWRDQALDLQGQIAEAVVRCEDERARIAALQQGAVGGVLVRGSHAIWSPDLWGQASSALPPRLAEVIAAYRSDLDSYLRDPAKHLPLHVAVLVLAFLALRAARGQLDRWATDPKGLARVTPVFNHPFAAALLLALMAATTITSPAPYTVKQLLNAVALAPVIVLARPLLPARLVPVLYTLGLLFTLDTLRHGFGGYPPLVDQAAILLASLIGILQLASVLRHRVQDSAKETPDARPQETAPLWSVLGALALLGFAIGLVASALGYLRLARLTTPAVLVGAADALWLYAVLEVATAVLAFALRVWPLRRLRLVRYHRALLDTRIRQILITVTVLSWGGRYLSYLGLWEPTLTHVSRWLNVRITLGSFSTSPGDILAFFATLVIAYLFSAALRFVLQEEVYPRAGVAPGVSYAASSVIHYAILTLAFLFALGALGVTLTQVTVLAGALGVGIGFGLQGIVNNFVSGLILLVERPVNVGDAVQIGDLQGWVRRIGIRASVVRTVQGAEIIVPNAQLTTEQVTNWTLSDQQRRVDIPVGLSYGVEPNTAIALLEGVARANARVLKNPQPQCLFMGYGDSSVNFQLRVWTDYAVWIQVQSELTVAIYTAVYAAGMSFPFPQREVRLLADPPLSPKAPGGATGGEAQ